MTGREDGLVVGVGNGLLVHTARVPAILPPGAKGEVLSIDDCAGGVTANSLVQLAALGVRTKWLGIVGGDDTAEVLVEALRDADVDVEVTHRTSGKTGFGLVITDREGERIGYCNQGVTRELTAEDVETLFGESLKAARALLVEVCQFPPCSTLKSVEIASAAGALVALDFDSSPSDAGLTQSEIRDVAAVLERCTVVSGSYSALREYTGLVAPSDICGYFLERGAQLAAATMGEDGCYLRTRAAGCHVPSFAVKAVDTTGAGDAFRAGLVYAYMHGLALEETGRLANACGAICCLSEMNQSRATKDLVYEFIRIQGLAGEGAARGNW